MLFGTINYFISPCISIVDISYFTMLILSYTVAEYLADIFHSLDIWPKAKSTRKCIQKLFSEFSIVQLLVWYLCKKSLCMLWMYLFYNDQVKGWVI